MHDRRRKETSPSRGPGPAYVSNRCLQAGLILLVGFIAYANTFQVPFHFDDPRSISEVPFVRDLRLFPNALILHRSVGFFSFALNYRLHGTDVVGYHIVNLAVHLISALLVYGLVLLLFRTPRLRGSFLLHHERPIALLSALLFVSHPVQTQAVTYIAQRFASLATLFFLAGTITYVASRLASLSSARLRPLAWYGLSLVFSVLAMKTKELAFTLPLAITLVEVLFFEGAVRRRLLLLLPLLLTMLVIPVSLLGTSRGPGDILADVSEATKVHTTLGRAEYLFTQFRVIVTYLRLLLLPADQNLDYDYPVFHSFVDPEVLFSFLLLALVLGTGGYLLRRDRHAPGAGRLTAFGIFWFFLTLSVESSVIPIADVIFEHRLYLPSIGFFLAVTTALFWGAERLRARWSNAVRTTAAALAAAVVVFTVLTVMRNVVWQSEVSLWEDVITKSPLKARAYNGLGLAYFNRNENDKAIEAFARAIALHPSYGVAFNNIGNALYHRGLYERAAEAQTRAIALEPKNPVFHYNRGLTHAARGDHDRAIEDYGRAISLDPGYAAAYNNLGLVYHVKGLYDRAIDAYTKALASSPGNSMFLSNRGLSHAAKGDSRRAIEDYSRAVALDPGSADAYNGRGSVLGLQGRYDEAITDFSAAISRNPGDPRFFTNRGLAFSRTGQRDRAFADFQRACAMGSETGCRALKQIK